MSLASGRSYVCLSKVTIPLVIIILIYPFSVVDAQHAADEGTWYIGKNIQENTYLRYEMTFDDTIREQFTFIIYFDKFDQKKNSLITQVFVVRDGVVLQETVDLSPLDLSILNSSDISSEMSPYLEAYNSLLIVGQRDQSSIKHTDW